MINQFIQKIQKQEIDIVEHFNRVIEQCKDINNEYHYFNHISDSAISSAKQIRSRLTNKEIKDKKRLLGIAVSVKDCICVKDMETTSGSKILEGYKPTYDAEVIRKIKEQDGIIIGKTAQDEFGFGGFSVNVGVEFKVPLNPFDRDRTCGGSSGGSAGITQKADFPHISIAESTGGSIVNPASFCGVFGLCPTYGRVSRYGLIDYANSLDKIGIMAKNIEDIALMLEIISGLDKKDPTSVDIEVEDYSNYIGKEVKGMRIGLIKEPLGEGTDERVKKQTLNYLDKLESFGITHDKVSLPITMEYGLSAYYLIATSEASTNLAKYCGLRYGRHEQLDGNFREYFAKVRGKNLGDEAKRRIMLGTFARMSGFKSAYYIKATKVRRMIIDEYKRLFKKFDLLLSPTVPILPPKFSEIKNLSIIQNYMIDILAVGPNLAGLPHLNVPVGFENSLPVGVMLIAPHFKEGRLIQVGGLLRCDN